MRLTKPYWYAIAVIIVVGGWMLGTMIAAGAWDTVRAASLTPATSTIDARGSSVAVFTDIPQPKRTISCQAQQQSKNDKKDSSDKDAAQKKTKSVDAVPAKIDLTVTHDGTVWTLVSMFSDGLDDMEVTCSPKDKRADSASYAIAPVDGFTSRVNVGVGTSMLSLAFGIGLAVFVWWSRRKARQTD